MGAANQPKQMMWEFTPPPGVSIQQWQTSIRFLFKEDRADEMLAWLRVQLQLCEEAVEQGLFYNKQPAPQVHSRQGKPRPAAVHHRRREPRRGTDDAAEEEEQQEEQEEERPRPRPVARQGGNVQALAGDAPMPPLTPGMAKPKAGAKPPGVMYPATAKKPTAVPPDDKEQQIAALKKRLGELGVQLPEEAAPDTQRKDQTMPPPAIVPESEPEEQAPDLSGPRIHRHTWSANQYEISEDNKCIKCGDTCTGIEALCPVP